MNDKKVVKAIIHYKDFLALKEEQIRDMLQNEYVEFLIFIKKEDYRRLNDAEKKKLYGFRRTEKEPLKVQIAVTEKLFELPTRIEIRPQTFSEKHKKTPKPYAPKNIINKNFNSRKKGGR